MPRVSVLLPVYNAERYLREAVDSILAQTFTDFELLAHDDGSTDNSLSVMRRYTDPRIVVTTGVNRGLVPALNDMIDRARGEYLARMDSDDVSEPSRFAKQAAHLDANAECVAISSRTLLIDAEGWPICEFNPLTGHDEIDAANLRTGTCHICHGATMFRKKALSAVGSYSGGFPDSEDLDLFLRLAEHGQIGALPEVLYRYRQHPASVCHKHANAAARKTWLGRYC